ncbi:unnamed protein product [Lactuca saligna]|uniref:PB1-like domain-containing protein n=1 Tax=Lactuca saligna TaxID=75948 RepID=A0AA35YBN0_LACSI|nr:unnamed protein product [Lactuca saligna]
MVSWRIRGEMAEIDVDQSYAGHPTMFSIRMHHGGEFTSFPGRKYIRGKQTFVDLLDIDTFSVNDIDEMMEDLGYASIGKPLYYHFQRPLGDLDFGLFALASDEDVRYLGSFVAKHKLIEVYIEHDKTTLHTYLMSPTHSKVRITEITEPPSCSKRLFLEWHSTPAVDLEDDMDHMEKESGNDPTPTGHLEKDLGNDATLTDHMENDLGNDATLTDHMENDLVNDANDFGTQDEALEVINTDFLASDSSSDEGINGQRKKSIRAIQRAHENDEALVSEPFYIFQKFGSAKEFKDKGTIPKLGPNVEVNDEEEICPWVLLASKWKKDVNWTVKTYNKVHKCLQTRTVKAWLCKNSYNGGLRDYIVELQTRNPDTTVRVDVESEGNPHSETRTFRRIYICLGALKKGFAAGKRDFLGFDGAFMKGPFPGQILSAVGLDGMEELKKLNKDCYEWLKKIPPQHWSRSHFTGRAHSDVILNNLCETFNGKLNEGRRPKKKRRKSAYEIDDMVKGNSASRILQSVTCSKCNNIGHNARSCKGQKASAPSGSGGPGGSGKGKGKAG